MRELDDLRRGLMGVNGRALGGWTLDQTALAGASAYAATVLRPSRQAGNLPDDFLRKLRDAINVLHSGRPEMNFRALRLACYGAATSIDNEPILLANLSSLQLLLKRVAEYNREPRRFRRLYAGLLSAYLSLNRAAPWFHRGEVQQGNDELRNFLAEAFHRCNGEDGQHPDWVDALGDYPEILSDKPGQRFASGLLDSDLREFEDATRRLGVPGTSWLPAEVFRSAVMEAASKSDKVFVDFLPKLLSVLADPRLQALQDEALGHLLTRYARMAVPSVHPLLRDTVVAAWKNPWLARNEAAWGRVQPAVRQMVASWLKLELIHQFFEVLSEEGSQDKSRFEFWRAYHDKMDDVYFALGSSAYRSNSPDLRKLKADLDGRLYELTGTDAETNAFIMFMGGVAVVEFSKKGNAAFLYARSDINFDLEKSSVSIRYLKREPPGIKLRHDRWWQQLFVQHLTGGSVARPARLATQTDQLEKIKDFAVARNVRLDDKTVQGGNVWLLVDDTNSVLAQELMDLGCSYKPGRGWWWSQQG